MIAKQLAYIKDLRWYEFLIVGSVLIPQVVVFKVYVKVLIKIARFLVIQ